MLFLLGVHVACVVFLKHASLCVSQGQQREDGQQQGFEWILQGQEWWKWMHSAR